MSFMIPLPTIRLEIAKRAKERRLSLNLSQKTLSQRSGVSLPSLRKFESTGQISLHSLLKLALVLEALDDFTSLFETEAHHYKNIEELFPTKKRKRGRK